MASLTAFWTAVSGTAEEAAAEEAVAEDAATDETAGVPQPVSPKAAKATKLSIRILFFISIPPIETQSKFLCCLNCKVKAFTSQEKLYI
jgi:hypothetical protein